MPNKHNIYHGTFQSREDLERIYPLHPDAEIHFAFGQQRFRGMTVQAFSAIYTMHERIFGVAGSRYMQDGEYTSWDITEKEMTDLDKARMANKLSYQRGEMSLEMLNVFDDVFDNLKLLQQSWEEGKKLEPDETLPFRGKLMLPSIGMGKEEMN